MPPEPGAGRFAPSPSGELHVGNLRTALLAWLFARSSGRRFLVRMEDLDRVKVGAAQQQLADLAALGLDWDGPVVFQSLRTSHYRAAIERLSRDGLTYECYCTRREIQQAASAPHGPEGAYPGTCRSLTAAQRAQLRLARPAALRLRSEVRAFSVTDELHGSFSGLVDDFVLRRGDDTPAYNLAVVVDDAAQGADQVVRGDDLLASSPRQAYLATLLELPVPRYAHVPLVLNGGGQRLAKRDGAVTLSDLNRIGNPPRQVLRWLAGSLGLTGDTPAVLLSQFVPANLPARPWTFRADNSGTGSGPQEYPHQAQEP